jgi:peptide/nickel transport system permease protein
VSSFVLQRLLSFFITLAVTSVVGFWRSGMVARQCPPKSSWAKQPLPSPWRPWKKNWGFINRLSRAIYSGPVACCKANRVLSISYSTPTLELITERLQVTLPLAIFAMLITVVLAFSMGLHAASKQNSGADLGVMTLSQLGLALPDFSLAVLLILLFAVQLQWVSAGGFPGWTEDVGGGVLKALRALILPAIALAAVQTAILTRVTRSAIIESMSEDYARTARAKGLSKQQVLWRHVLRNAMIPVVTIMGLQFGNLITSAIVIENVFVLPGMGRLVFQAIANRDLMVVRDVVMCLSAMVIAINFLIDIVYAWIDPRLQHGLNT